MGVVLMRDFKFDIDVILRNCERFGVKVESGENIHGVTMNGKSFNVTEEMSKALKELDSVTSITTSGMTATLGQMNQENFGMPEVKATWGTAKCIIPEQASFPEQYASLNAA